MYEFVTVHSLYKRQQHELARKGKLSVKRMPSWACSASIIKLEAVRVAKSCCMWGRKIVKQKFVSLVISVLLCNGCLFSCLAAGELMGVWEKISPCFKEIRIESLHPWWLA